MHTYEASSTTVGDPSTRVEAVVRATPRRAPRKHLVRDGTHYLPRPEAFGLECLDARGPRLLLDALRVLDAPRHVMPIASALEDAADGVAASLKAYRWAA